MKKQLIVIGLILLIFSACQTSKKGIEKLILIGAETKPCSNGVSETQCLQVKWHKDQKEWENFYGSIKGFTPENGTEYELLVIEENAENVPADDSTIKYKLVKTISKTKLEKYADTHTNQNSLDWDGAYDGILPCADCEGIKTNIIINKNGTFSKTVTYLKNGENNKFSDTGTFEWNKEGTKISLILPSEKKHYLVGENKLIALDIDGNLITGNLAEAYVLTKVALGSTHTIEDRKWKLISFMGKKINKSADDYYIIFHSKGKALETKVGCNGMRSTYKINDEINTITIEKIMSTMMACEHTLVEEYEYSQKLETVTNYTTNGKRLQLNAARMIVSEYELQN